MDPTLHYKMKADEAHDGSGKGLQPRYVHRDPMQEQKVFSVVNIEPDVHAECNEGTVNKFGYFSR